MAYANISTRVRKVKAHNSVQPVDAVSYTDDFTGTVTLDKAIANDNTPISIDLGGAPLSIANQSWQSVGGVWQWVVNPGPG